MNKKVVNLFFECLHMKRIKHEWWRMALVDNPDSIAEHSLNAAQIWYILAKMEWADANKVAAMMVWHDIAETRLGDLHKVAVRYIKGKKEIEKQIMQEQISWVPWENDLHELFHEYEERTTLEWRIAKDADYLEMAFQWRIYLEQWHEAAQNRIDNVWVALQTQSAKEIWKTMLTMKPTDWRLTENLKELNNL